MRAVLTQNDAIFLGDGEVAQLVLWEAPEPVPGSTHKYKYRFAYVVDDACVLRFDNERDNGDRFRVGAKEYPYSLVSIEQLNQDFWTEVWKWQQKIAGR
jgi:hypothetical protein